jgi:hypothetical protein
MLNMPIRYYWLNFRLKILEIEVKAIDWFLGEKI